MKEKDPLMMRCTVALGEVLRDCVVQATTRDEKRHGIDDITVVVVPRWLFDAVQLVQGACTSKVLGKHLVPGISTRGVVVCFFNPRGAEVQVEVIPEIIPAPPELFNG